jgi:hypothetical protein
LDSGLKLKKINVKSRKGVLVRSYKNIKNIKYKKLSNQTNYPSAVTIDMAATLFA